MKNKRIFAVVIAVLMAFTMCFDTGITSAKSLSDLQKEIKEKQQELKEGKKKEKDLAKKIDSLEESIYELEDQIEAGEVKLEKLEKDLVKAQKKVDQQNDDLSVRLRNMYKNGSIGFLDVLMNSGSFSEFLTNMDMVQIVYASDQNVLQDLKKAHEEIKEKKKKVEELQEELKASKATAASQKKAVEAEKTELAADNEETAKMLDEMENEAAAMAAELARKAREGSISSSDTSKYEGGAFCWPVPSSGRITSNYGNRICPFHGREFHPAIDIGASMGAPVLAAADGIVISSSYRRSFGNCIIIDHGGGVTTWYNHLSVRLVGVGATVSKGQQIAKVGSTGSSTGPHLDFRVYIDGVSQNPLAYFGQ